MGIISVLQAFIIAIVLTLSSVSRWWRIAAAILWFIGFGTLIAAYKGLCLILYRGHIRNLRPWEEYDNESRSSYESTTPRELHLAEKTSNGNVNYRPGSMQSFGSRNDEEPAWMEKYQKKPLLRKVFDKETWTQDPTLRLLQDRIVIGSQVWSFVCTTILTIIFVALPKGNFFWCPSLLLIPLYLYNWVPFLSPAFCLFNILLLIAERKGLWSIQLPATCIYFLFKFFQLHEVYITWPQSLSSISMNYEQPYSFLANTMWLLCNLLRGPYLGRPPLSFLHSTCHVCIDDHVS